MAASRHTCVAKSGRSAGLWCGRLPVKKRVVTYGQGRNRQLGSGGGSHYRKLCLPLIPIASSHSQGKVVTLPCHCAQRQCHSMGISLSFLPAYCLLLITRLLPNSYRWWILYHSSTGLIFVCFTRAGQAAPESGAWLLPSPALPPLFQHSKRPGQYSPRWLC